MVTLSDVQNMFWGVTLDGGGKKYTQTVERGFHISMAALEPIHNIKDAKEPQFVSVMVQHDSAEFLICTLQHGKLYNQPLDLNFTDGEEVTFFLNGQGVLHLTGYLIEEEEIGEELGSEDSDESDESDYAPPDLMAVQAGGDEEEEEEESSEMDSSDDEEEEEATTTSAKRKKVDSIEKSRKKQKITELEMDSEEDSDSDSEEDETFESFFDMEAEEDNTWGDEDDEEDDDDDDDDDDDETQESEDIGASFIEKKKKKKNKEKTPKEKTPKEKTPKEKTPKEKKQKEKETPSKSEAETPGEKEQQPMQNGDTTEKKKKKKKRKKNKNKGEETPGSTPQTESKVNGAQQKTPSQKTPTTDKKSSTPQTPSTGKKTPKKQVMEGGLIVEELKEGHGPEARPGKMVHAYYKGTLSKNGKVFDSNLSGKPFRFKMGKKEVIQGWDIGFKGMKVGGKRRLTVPPKLGYGGQRTGEIPPNSTLMFDVELKAVS